MARRPRPRPIPKMTLAQFEATFPGEQACKSYLQARRWPNGIHCPRCGSTKVFPVRTVPFKWQCYTCAPNQGYRFSVITGTIFENTNKPLREWFRVVHLMLAGKKGTSALEIQRIMDSGSYEITHSMCHKIRAALTEPEEKVGGIVEVDEPYIGSKAINKHGGRSGTIGGIRGRTPIIGAISRKGNVVTRVLERVTKKRAEASFAK
jgi:transposase-like protein